MNKPEKPNIIIPESFAENGVKTDFDSNKILNGFDRIQPDVLAGDNLNKFIDDTYKGLNYALSFGDYIENKVSKTGDTMTGILNFKQSDTLDFTNTNNAVYTEAGAIYFRDKNDKVCGQVRNYFNEYNNLATSIEARRSVNGAIKTSQIQLYVDKDGNNVVTAPSGVVPNSVVTTLACSRAGSGYYKLGNGLIIQWGSAVVPANETDVVVTLPITFQHGYKVTANHAGSDGAPDQTNIMCAINSNSQFTLNNRGKNSTNMTRYWIAIGA